MSFQVRIDQDLPYSQWAGSERVKSSTQMLPSTI